MTCPHCGAQAIPGSRFCNKCRKRLVVESPSASRPAPASQRAPVPPRRPTATPRADRSAPGRFTRPSFVTLLAVLNILGGVAGVVLGVLMVSFLAWDAGLEKAGLAMMVFAAYGLVGAVQIATGVGLLRLKPWGRILQLGLAVVGLLGIPCGTIISILVLVYMLKPEVKTLFSGIPPGRLPPAEVARVERLSQGFGAMEAVVVVVVVIGVVVLVGMTSAILIPAFMRARVSANESAALGSLRTVISAQQSYSMANEGFPDKPECLATPTQCIPGYPAGSPVFLDSSLLAPERRGYQFRFVAGPPAPAEIVQGGQVSPTSLNGWAYVAVPLEPGQSGRRSFCADMSGVLCFRPDGNPPDASSGACPVSMNDVGASDCIPLMSPF